MVSPWKGGCFIYARHPLGSSHFPMLAAPRSHPFCQTSHNTDFDYETRRSSFCDRYRDGYEIPQLQIILWR